MREARALVRGGTLALLLVAIAAQPALAVFWDGERKLSSAETVGHELIRTGPQSALMVWRGGAGVLARRTTDGGQTWLPVRTIAPNAGDADVAGVGARLDVAYVVRTTCAATGARALRIFYRRSLDGGVTWSTPVALTSACSRTYEPAVARSADGQVSVAWVGELTGRIFVRTSRNGGASFGPAVHAATTTAVGGDACASCTGIYLADPSIAIGSGGATYLAYSSAFERISLRRSTTRGSTWQSPRTFATRGLSIDSLVADGRRAVIGYTVMTSSMRAVFRTTTDGGATWSGQRPVIGVSSGQFSTRPAFATDDGVLAVVVKRGAPGTSPVWYSESEDWGATWTAASRVSVIHGPGPDPEAAGLALLDETVLAGYAETGETVGLWVRRGDR